MSNYLAIATVTAALQRRLQMALTDHIGQAMVTTHRPGNQAQGGPNSAAINVYLYQAVPNAAWRNQRYELRYPPLPLPPGAPSQDLWRVERRPLVPLNLHYLISFYGDEAKLVPQRLMGLAIAALQDNAFITPDLIARVKSDSSYSYLAETDLDVQASQVERVKFTPIELDLESLSKLWSVFFQVPYALSVAYEASVVLIEGEPRTPISVPTQATYQVGPDVPASQEAAPARPQPGTMPGRDPAAEMYPPDKGPDSL